MEDEMTDVENENLDQSPSRPVFLSIGPDLWQTPRLTLRPPQISDLPFLSDMFARPELTRHRPDPTPDDAAASAARLDRDMAHWAEHGFGRWAVLDGEKIVGFGGVAHSLHYDALNLSYHMHPDCWGRGFASEIARAAVFYARHNLQAPLIIGLARAVNPASQRVLIRAGLVYQRDVLLYGEMTGLFELR
jgi:RimJ/RimL family protein N-acetyltransferase